jgi:hypothetical protein
MIDHRGADHHRPVRAGSGAPTTSPAAIRMGAAIAAGAHPDESEAMVSVNASPTLRPDRLIPTDPAVRPIARRPHAAVPSALLAEVASGARER